MRKTQKEKLTARLLAGQYGWSEKDSREAAGRVIKRALGRGHLRRPIKCSKCKSIPGLDAVGASQIQAVHLKGYSFEHRFDFEWLCVSCRSRIVWKKKHLKEGRKRKCK